MNSTPDSAMHNAPPDVNPSAAVNARGVEPAVDHAADSGQAAEQAHKQRPRLQWLGITLPGPVSDVFYAIGDFGQRCRRSTITALPSFVVNRSSNVIAAIQLTGEGMMLKANGTNFIPDKYIGSYWRYPIEAPKSVFRSVFKGAASGIQWSQLGKPSYLKTVMKGFVDLDTATKLDSVGGRLLINRWQARSTFAGLVGMCIAAVFPDVKDTPEELEKRVTLRHQHPLRYMGKTIGEALWFPVGVAIYVVKNVVTLGQCEPDNETGKYKRQFTGLSLMIAGVCSFLSGFRNVGQIDKAMGKNVPTNLKYVFNKAHSIAGAITGFAGSQLLFAVGSDQGWERFGAIQWLRMAFLPESIRNRYKNHDPRAHWYVGGQIGLQSANTASFLIGGAEKLDDGTIVDHKTVRDEAKQQALEKKAQRWRVSSYGDQTDELRTPLRSTNENDTVPTATVSNAQNITRAMPERLGTPVVAAAGVGAA